MGKHKKSETIAKLRDLVESLLEEIEELQETADGLRETVDVLDDVNCTLRQLTQADREEIDNLVGSLAYIAAEVVERWDGNPDDPRFDEDGLVINYQDVAGIVAEVLDGYQKVATAYVLSVLTGSIISVEQ